MPVKKEQKIEKRFFEIDEDLTYDSPLLSGLTEVIKASAIRRDENLAFASALMTLNLFATREVITPTYSSMIMYLGILTPSGYGKDSFLRAPAEILISYGQKGVNVRESVASVPGLEKAFRVSPVVYNQIDELSNLFERITKSKGSNVELALDTFLKSKWGIEHTNIGITTETKDRDAVVIEYPILNIFGASTNALYSSMHKRALSDGFYNRFLIVEASDVPKSKTKIKFDLATSIIKGLLKFDSLSAASGEKFERVIPQFKVPWDTTEVEARFYVFDDEIEAIRHEHITMHQLFVRLPEMALRMATLIAVSRDFSRARITMRDLEFAINFVKKSGNTSVYYTTTLQSGDSHEETLQRVKRFIERSDVIGVNGRDICRSLRINRVARDRAVNDLMDFGFITAAKASRPSQRDPNKMEQTILYFSTADDIQERLKAEQQC